MIIIKIIILYFIQIRHTDDFPSTGTRLVSINFRKHKKYIRGKMSMYSVNGARFLFNYFDEACNMVILYECVHWKLESHSVLL